MGALSVASNSRTRDRLAVLSGVASYQSAVMANSPLAYYRLEETVDGTAADSSGNGHNGTMSNTPTLNQTGKVNKCFLFDNASSESVTLPTGLFTAINGSSLTVEAWINPDEAKASNNWFGVDNNSGSTDDRSFVCGLDSSRRLVFTKIANGVVTATGGTALTLGTWYHVACTYDGSNIRLYVNGVIDASPSATSGSTKGAASTNPRIAFQGRSPGDLYFSGLIDEVAIYTSVLTAGQLLAHYSAA